MTAADVLRALAAGVAIGLLSVTLSDDFLDALPFILGANLLWYLR